MRAQRLIAKAGNSASPLPKKPNQRKACTGKAQAREIEIKEKANHPTAPHHGATKGGALPPAFSRRQSGGEGKDGQRHVKVADFWPYR